MAGAVKFANTVDDFTAFSSLSAQIAKFKDRTDGAKGPGGDGSLGAFLLRVRDWAQGGGVVWPVINKTGGTLAADKLVEITGYDEPTGRFKVGLADNSTSKPAWAVLPAGLADGAAGDAHVDVLLPSSGLDTTAAAKGDLIYLSTAGDFTLTAPATTAIQTVRQVVGFVETLAVSGTIRLKVQTPRWQGADIKTYVDGQCAPEKASALDVAGDRVTGLAVGNTATFATKYTIGAGKLKVGSVIRFRASGLLTTKPAGSGQTEQFQVRLGTVVIGLASPALSGAFSDPFHIDGEVVVRAVGAGGKFCGGARVSFGVDGIGTMKIAGGATVNGAINTTAAQDVDVQCVFAADAVAGDTVDLASLTVDVLDTTT